MEFPRLLFKDHAEVTAHSASDYAAKLAEGYTDPSVVADKSEKARHEPEKGRHGKH